MPERTATTTTQQWVNKFYARRIARTVAIERPEHERDRDALFARLEGVVSWAYQDGVVLVKTIASTCMLTPMVEDDGTRLVYLVDILDDRSLRVHCWLPAEDERVKAAGDRLRASGDKKTGFSTLASMNPDVSPSVKPAT